MMHRRGPNDHGGTTCILFGSPFAGAELTPLIVAVLLSEEPVLSRTCNFRSARTLPISGPALREHGITEMTSPERLSQSKRARQSSHWQLALAAHIILLSFSSLSPLSFKFS